MFRPSPLPHRWMVLTTLLALAALAAGCGDDPPPEGEPGPVGTADAGTSDAGGPAPSPDASQPADAGGTSDAGSGGPDAGPSGPLGPTDSVIPNADFEEWSAGAPVSWLGPETTIAAVEQVDVSPFTGAHACRLVNEGDTHRRFATVALSLPAGHYSCTFRVRGQGEVRAGTYALGAYRYGSYTVASADWKEVPYPFNLASDDSGFAFIFSVRNTVAPEHVVVDRVACTRDPSPCDTVSCPAWATCNPATVACEPNAGRCADIADCLEWESCDSTNTCVLAPGRCRINGDCDLAGATPVCDATHTCVAGDPCAGVLCDEWRQCRPADRACVTGPGRCRTTAECGGALPACDGATHTCVGADAAANVFPNGGFEAWSVRAIPYHGTPLVPDAWYGLFEDLADQTAASEIDPAALVPYAAAPHGGATACQIVQPPTGNPADRFTSEDFDIPAGDYTCAYWVRGKGDFRHRTYSSAGWSPLLDFESIDTDQWQQRTFSLTGNVRFFRLIFYVSNTDAAKDHLQIDDVVCTLNGSY